MVVSRLRRGQQALLKELLVHRNSPSCIMNEHACGCQQTSGSCHHGQAALSCHTHGHNVQCDCMAIAAVPRCEYTTCVCLFFVGWLALLSFRLPLPLYHCGATTHGVIAWPLQRAMMGVVRVCCRKLLLCGYYWACHSQRITAGLYQWSEWLCSHSSWMLRVV